jgi:hypothetical protein
VAIIAIAIRHTFDYDRDTTVPVEDVERFEAIRTAQLARRP